MSSKKTQKVNKTKKIIILFLLIALFLVVLLISAFRTISEKRDMPTLRSSKKELAVRGDIISKDNFKLATSKKLYTASIDTRYLDKNKKELFLKLFSIYSNTPYKKLKKKLSTQKKEGNLILSYNIDSRSAKNLKELSFKLRKLKVFIPRKINGSKILRTLAIRESGEKRIFSYEDMLTPVLGYITKFETKNGKTKVKGVKGLERSYNKVLNETKNGLLKGNRDVLSYISFDKNSIIRKRIDGANLHLSIPLKLQKNNEIVLDKFKKKLGADEIIATIMNSHTGEIITMASSNRFNPQRIKQKDVPSLNVKAIEYPFEPGSIMKPLSIALVMDKGRVDRKELFNAHNKGKTNKKGEYPRGRYPLGRFTINDDHNFKKRYLTLKDIVIFSSNIGTLQIAQRLNGPEFYEGMKRFGFTRKSGIDLPYEKVGVMPSIKKFSRNDKRKKDNVYKATVSYGQGITTTSLQILKAYTVFNNNGYAITPKIVSYLNYDNNDYKPYDDKKEKIISKKTANDMKKLLIQTVQEGTGRASKIDGLIIGGKTGTAQISGGKKGYLKKYISSFFGFANDSKGNSYTIGVTVFNPISKGKYWYYYYASQSAVPTFKAIVENLVKLNYLKPNKDIIANSKNK